MFGQGAFLGYEQVLAELKPSDNTINIPDLLKLLEQDESINEQRMAPYILGIADCTGLGSVNATGERTDLSRVISTVFPKTLVILRQMRGSVRVIPFSIHVIPNGG